MTKRVVPCLLVAVALLGGCGGASESPPPSATVTTAPEDVTSVAAPSRSRDVAVATFEVPDLVGVNLQHAVESLEAAGARLIDRQDATGLERIFVNDSMWTVCAQVPAAGETATAHDAVTLWVQKLGEPCP